jgi:hypothetical protein
MFEIFLETKKPLTILLDSAKFTVSKFNPVKLNLSETKSFSFDYFYNGDNSIIHHCRLDFVDGNFVSSLQNIRIIKMGQNAICIQFLDKIECFLQKKCKKIAKNDLIFNFYQNGIVDIEDDSSVKFCKNFDFEIVDADVVGLTNNFYAINLFGKFDLEKTIILNNAFEDVLCFDNCILEPTENGFKVLCNLYDIASHGVVQLYQINQEASLVEQYTVYLKEYPNNMFNPNILPIYFLQNIKAQDFAEAKKCLSQQLQLKVKSDHLKTYFGDFCDILIINQQIYLIYQANSNKYFAKNFNFVVAEGKIVEIK